MLQVLTSLFEQLQCTISLLYRDATEHLHKDFVLVVFTGFYSILHLYVIPWQRAISLTIYLGCCMVHFASGLCLGCSSPGFKVFPIGKLCSDVVLKVLLYCLGSSRVCYLYYIELRSYIVNQGPVLLAYQPVSQHSHSYVIL